MPINPVPEITGVAWVIREKPRLVALEARHRLAPKEGLKENKT
jgi:hypothetical protein